MGKMTRISLVNEFTDDPLKLHGGFRWVEIKTEYGYRYHSFYDEKHTRDRYSGKRAAELARKKWECRLD